jgi:hypothetical protein
MKPKLAIYGDSHAQPASNAITRGHWLAQDELCWAYNPIITSNYNVTNFANSGADFYSYYEMFCNDHGNYDKIIFIVTQHTRLGFKYKDKSFCLSSPHSYNVDLSWAEDQFDNEIDKARIREIYYSAYIHFMYRMHDKFYEAGVAKLVEEMQEIRSDMIIVPAFYNRYLDKKYNGFFMGQVGSLDQDFFGIGGDEYSNLKDLRPAHMTIENNKIFADLMYKKLQGENIEWSIDHFVLPKPEEKSKYYMS